MGTGADAVTATNAQVGVDFYVVTASIVTKLDGTGGNAGMTVGAFILINIDNLANWCLQDDSYQNCEKCPAPQGSG